MVRELFRWRSGRQGTGYQKMLLFQSRLLMCDLWLLRSDVGTEIPPHCDPAPVNFGHFRLNVILRHATSGGVFTGDTVYINRPRIKLFRSDHLHQVSRIHAGRRLVLSAGILLRRSSMPTPPKTATTIHTARELIEKKGWAKGVAKDNAGRICLLTAVQQANNGAAIQAEMERIILNLTGTKSMPEFNDRASTTKDDVLIILAAAENIAIDLGGA